MPGMLTGAIIGMSRALGETAPLLMIGMVAFIVDIPNSFTEPATVLPVQIYLWGGQPRAGVCRAHLGGYHDPADVFNFDECAGGISAQTLRATLVRGEII